MIARRLLPSSAPPTVLQPWHSATLLHSARPMLLPAWIAAPMRDCLLREGSCPTPPAMAALMYLVCMTGGTGSVGHGCSICEI